MAVGPRPRRLRKGRTHRRRRDSFSIDTLIGMVSNFASKGADLAGKAFTAIASGAAAAVAVRTGFHLPPEVAVGIGAVAGAVVQSMSDTALDRVRSEWQKARTATPGKHRAGAVSNRAPPGNGATATKTMSTKARGVSGMSLKDELVELLETARGQYDTQDQTSGMINDKAEEMSGNFAALGSDEQAQAVSQARDAAVEAIAQARAVAEKGLDDAVALVHQAIP